MIRNVRIITETKKAYLFKFVSGKNTMWVPKSCIISMNVESKTKSVPTGILSVNIKDSFYRKNYIKPERHKVIPYDDTAEILDYHRTNTKMTFIEKIKKSKWNK